MDRQVEVVVHKLVGHCSLVGADRDRVDLDSSHLEAVLLDNILDSAAEDTEAGPGIRLVEESNGKTHAIIRLLLLRITTTGLRRRSTHFRR